MVRRSPMRTLRFTWVTVTLALVTLAGAACGQGASDTSTSSDGPRGSASEDLLARIMADGLLRVATDPRYPPQSSFDESSGTWAGFDIDVATEIATRLHVTVDWRTPPWELVDAGSWNDEWDVSVGSMTVTEERAQVLDFSEPYYYTPAGLAVQLESDITSLDQLSGKTIGVCGACSYEFYLDRTLNIPGYDFEYLIPEDVTVVTYDTDSSAIQDLGLGRLDAVMSAVPTLESAIDRGKPIELLGDPVFYEPLAVATDKSAPLPDESLIDRLNQIITDMHQDGTLAELSLKWYKQDLTTNPLAD
jgi:polar amino acid transport system substrate-binding protein